MKITTELLRKIVPTVTIQNLNEYSLYLDLYCNKFGIVTGCQFCGFISQVAHESSNLNVTSENLNYSSSGLIKIFPKYFSNATALVYQRKPEKIANRVYANKLGNGNELSGDGWKYRGRGLIQITGKDNYSKFNKWLQLNKLIDSSTNVVLNPDVVSADKKIAVLSAIWFWVSNNLNKFCTDFSESNFIKLTKVINGGTNGYEDRKNIWVKAQKFIKSN